MLSQKQVIDTPNQQINEEIPQLRQKVASLEQQLVERNNQCIELQVNLKRAEYEVQVNQNAMHASVTSQTKQVENQLLSEQLEFYKQQVNQLSEKLLHVNMSSPSQASDAKLAQLKEQISAKDQQIIKLKLQLDQTEFKLA